MDKINAVVRVHARTKTERGTVWEYDSIFPATHTFDDMNGVWGYLQNWNFSGAQIPPTITAYKVEIEINYVQKVGAPRSPICHMYHLYEFDK